MTRGAFHWRAFAPLALLRGACALAALAMVHPDEFFQSQEVMARLVVRDDDALKQQLHVPWEFTLPTPNRSVLFPFLVAGLPYKLLQALGIPLSGYVMLVVPRLLLCIASFSVDAALFACAKAIGERDPMAVVTNFASSWPALIFLTRPFSNTFETFLLAFSMAALLCFNPHQRVFFNVIHVQTVLLGSLLAFGFFTRFTFPLFFLPIGLELVRRQDELLCQQLAKKEIPTPPKKRTKESPHKALAKKEPWDWTKEATAKPATATTEKALLQRRLVRAISIGLQGFFAFVVWSLAIIAIDTWYFRGEFPTTTNAWSRAIVAPLNNVLYNMQHSNLELHGVHPRVTHALVNMPMLFGPLYLVFVSQLKTFRERLWQAGSVVIPLFFISLAPHQEPRFLLPLLVPLHLFHGSAVAEVRWKQFFWTAFNALLAIFFGVLHQGGLLPLLLSLSSKASPALLSIPFTGCVFTDDSISTLNTPIVFYKTYMPPRFALADPLRPFGSDFRVVDLAGGHSIETQLRDNGVADLSEFLLVTPASINIENVISAWGPDAAGAKTRVVGTCFPHVSTEDLDWNKPFELVIYHWTRPSFVARLWEATTSVFSS